MERKMSDVNETIVKRRHQINVIETYELTDDMLANLERSIDAGSLAQLFAAVCAGVCVTAFGAVETVKPGQLLTTWIIFLVITVVTFGLSGWFWAVYFRERSAMRKIISAVRKPKLAYDLPDEAAPQDGDGRITVL